ncbi:MAG: restriction endonuclease subunit S [Weeksellaceae bacterium]|jgi:type I restriction enzyme S subunit|nr:restriction endonuclease subunit S [Weeksellaceae bacterium]
MKQSWDIKKLRDVIVENRKSTLKSKGNFEGDFPFFISGKTIKTINISIIDGDNIYLPTGGNFYIHYYSGKASYSTDTWSLRTNSSADIKYFFYFLLLNENIIGEKHFKGATIKHLQKNDFKEIEFPIPPRPEQQHIVSILDECFAAIDKAKANAEQNLLNAKELFESYLKTAFENKVHGERFESLDNLCELIVDCEHKTAPTQEIGYPSIRTPNIGKGELILENVNRVSYETYLQWTRRAVPKSGDLILAREAPAGNIAVIPENIEVCLGQRTVLLRPKKDRLVSKYLAYLILSKEVQEILLSHSTGATVQHINMKDIRAFKIYDLSDLKEQIAVVHKLDSLRAETQKLEAIYQKKIDDLDELKKSILQKAFAGELKTEIKVFAEQV